MCRGICVIVLMAIVFGSTLGCGDSNKTEPVMNTKINNRLKKPSE
jgi:hypothetical protein